MSVSRRLFIGVPVNASLAALLVDCARNLLEQVGTAGWRAVYPDNLHLTLAFLGQVADERQPELAAIMQEAAGGHRPVPLRLTSIDVFPDRRRPRVLAAFPAASEPLVALQASLAAGLRSADFALESRPYRPHVSLARSRGRGAALPSPRTIDLDYEGLHQMVLFESCQCDGRLRYLPLHRQGLG